MSIRFSVMKWLVQLLGTKRLTSLPPEKMLRRIRHANQRNHFFVPQDEGFLYRDEVISLTGIDGAEGFADQEQKASFHCLTICHKEQAENAPKKRGILCVYGGGMLLSPPRLFVGFAKDMAKKTGLDVWFPYYPLCDSYTIRDSVRMVYKVYESMCREYEEVCWYGYSSGGALLLLLGAYLNEIKSPLLVRARKLILISPGGVPVNEKEWQDMQDRDELDVMLSARYMQTIQPLLKHGCQDIPTWMQTCEQADLRGLPETWIYYGTHEVLFAKAKFYDDLLTQAEVLHHMKIAPKMPHCYCTTVFFPEAQADYDETMRILTED